MLRVHSTSPCAHAAHGYQLDYSLVLLTTLWGECWYRSALGTLRRLYSGTLGTMDYDSSSRGQAFYHLLSQQRTKELMQAWASQLPLYQKHIVPTAQAKTVQWVCLSCSLISLGLRRTGSIHEQAMPTRSMYWVRENSRTKTTEKTRDKCASVTWTCTAGYLAEEDNFQQHYLKGLESYWSLRKETLKGSGRERCLSTNFPLGTRVCV